MATVTEIYKSSAQTALLEQYGYANTQAVPKITRVVLNCTLKDVVQDSKKLQIIIDELAAITGQKPVATIAKNSIAGFKLREGMPIGAKVTLRKAKMHEFLDRLINIALPRVRDFRGLSPKSFDGNGNYALGIKEQIVFPEINYDKVDKIHGLDIIICTSAKTDAEALSLLKLLNFPFVS